jgi:tRNA(Leu) C34 or U34 (ribose-2'-O)-methylase TrmL
MPGPVRSLNLANAAAIVTMTALQQITPELFT